jgi:acetyl esterase
VPLHPQARSVVDLLESFGDPSIATSAPEDVRAARRARLRPSTIELPEIREVDASGVRCRLYRPSIHPELGLFVYLHGGGWVLGDLDTHDHFTRALASLSGHAVFAVEYALAPEHPFPAGLDDAVTVAHWVHAHATELGCDPGRLAIGGDSAGANSPRS